jgi:hypothetical protein
MSLLTKFNEVDEPALLTEDYRYQVRYLIIE